MRFYKLLIGLTLLVMLSNSAFAELNLIKRKVVPFEVSDPQMKLVSNDGHEYLVATAVATSLRKTKFSFLEIEDFFDGHSPRRIQLNDSPIFQAVGTQHGLLAVANGRAEWRVIKLNETLTKVEKYGSLKSMLAVGQITKIEDKYYISGIDKENKLILLRMNTNLRVERERIADPMTEGGVGRVFATAGKIYALVGFTDRSEIWEITADFAPLKKIKLSGLVVDAIPLKDGGFAVTYQTPKNLDYFVERFNSSGQPEWKKRIFTVALTGAGTLPVLCELPNGLCLVAGNNNRLLVARIDASGRRVRITEDTRSGLGIPSDPFGYLVGVRDNKIHVRGRVRASDAKGSTILFHFVETSTP